MARKFGIAIVALAVLAAGAWASGLFPPAGSGDAPRVVDAKPDAAFTSLDGKERFYVPGEGDPHHEDYQRMLEHPRFRSGLRDTDGYALPYDPEWRSEVTGVRQAPPVDMPLWNARSSREELVEELLGALAAGDAQAIDDLRVRREEWEILCWPSFPQSRPYVRVPMGEAWGFHYAKLQGGLSRGMAEFGGKEYELVGVQWGAPKDYGNFVLHSGVRIQARELDSGQLVEIDLVESLLESGGEWKLFSFRD